MDWLPTFLAAAGGAPMPTSRRRGSPLRRRSRAEPCRTRTLFWRFKPSRTGARCAADGCKFLEIAGKEFLFDVVADPMERANLK